MSRSSYFGRVDLVPDVQVEGYRIPDEGVRLLDLPDDEYRQGLIDGLARSPVLVDLLQVYLRPPGWHLRPDEETSEEWSEPMSVLGPKVDVDPELAAALARLKALTEELEANEQRIAKALRGRHA